MALVPGDHCCFSSIVFNDALEASEDACWHHTSPCEGDQYHSLANGPGIVLRQLRQFMPFAQWTQGDGAVRTFLSSFLAIVHLPYKALPTITLL